jgi:gluconokinase
VIIEPPAGSGPGQPGAPGPASAVIDHLVVIGVSGTGKTTVGQRVADQLDRAFADADDFHPEANIAKMAAGTPLSDRDRLPWLAELRDWMSAQFLDGRQTVVACSALRRSYREVLVEAAGTVFYVELVVAAQVIEMRMSQREHFMPVALLRSQLQMFESLQADESGMPVDAGGEVGAVVEQVTRVVTRSGRGIGSWARPRLLAPGEH